MQVFGKEESFDPRTDPIVRVQARRLRAKLVHHYREEGRADELILDLPKGGYAPVFRRRETPVLIKRSIGAALVRRNTVAVLPFADHSEAGDLQYFCRGIREEIGLLYLEYERLLSGRWGPVSRAGGRIPGGGTRIHA